MHVHAVMILAAIAIQAHAADLYGITADGRFVVIDTESGQAQSLFDTDADGGAMAYVPGASSFAIVGGASEPGSLSLIALDGTVTEAGKIIGLPAGQQKTGSVGYSGEGDDLFVTFGQSGTFNENRIARLRLDAVVTQVSEDVGMGDNDGIVWDDFNSRTIVYDYNANDGLPRVAEANAIFTAPYYLPVAQPPSRGDVGDSAVDPETGRLYVAGYDATGGFLVEVNQHSYTDIGAFNVGAQIVGIAFGPAAPCNQADLALPRGILDLADINAFITAFTTQAPAADLTPDGLFDLTDVTAFIAAFTAGCP